MTYIPSNRIKTDLYTNGTEYQIESTGVTYVGPYWKKYTGEIFTGKNPNETPSQKLVPINNPSNNALTDNTSYSFMEIDDVPKPLVIEYLNIKNIDPTTLTKNLPTSHYPKPTEDDYKLGVFTRYFCVKSNELVYYELDKKTYDKLVNQDKEWLWELYIPFQIPWTLIGDEKEVCKINTGIINLQEQRNKRKGLNIFLKGDCLKFWKGSSITSPPLIYKAKEPPLIENIGVFIDPPSGNPPPPPPPFYNINDLFITTWQTTTSNESITFPLTAVGGANMTINWGDGTTETGLGDNPSHTYAAASTYTVFVSGTYDAVYFNNTGSKLNITSIEQWGTTQWSTMNRAFYGCANLQGNATDSPNLSNVTTMSNMFRSATSFNQDIGSWNVSSVGDMSLMFYGARYFNQDIGSWNVSSVGDMSRMFYNATDFNQDIGAWDVSGVRDMSYMFYNATSFNQDIGTKQVTVNEVTYTAWDVSRNIGLAYMFYGAISFDQDIGRWDVSGVDDMSYMFSGATSFNQDINTKQVTVGEVTYTAWDMSSVDDMSSMFDGATSFNQDIGDWDVSNVTNMSLMFDGVTLSTVNYDNLLIGWEAPPPQSGVIFSAGSSTFTKGGAAEASKTTLETTYGWIITDGGGV